MSPPTLLTDPETPNSSSKPYLDHGFASGKRDLILQAVTAEDYHPSSPGPTVISAFISGASQKKGLQTPGSRVFKAVPEHVRENYVRRLQTVFELVDADGNGVLEYVELVDFLIGMGKSRVGYEEVRMMMSSYDMDGKNALNFEEFLNMMQHYFPVKELYKLGSKSTIDKNDVKAIADSLVGGLHDLSAEEESKLVALANPRGPSMEPLFPYESEAELRMAPFYQSLGGFECGKCQISSENLVNRKVWYCPKLETGGNGYVLCSMCASSSLKRDLERLLSEKRLEKAAVVVEPPKDLGDHVWNLKGKARKGEKVKSRGEM